MHMEKLISLVIEIVIVVAIIITVLNDLDN